MPCQNSYIVERSRSGLHPACATKTGSAAHPAMVPASSGCRGRRRITGLLDTGTVRQAVASGHERRADLRRAGADPPPGPGPPRLPLRAGRAAAGRGPGAGGDRPARRRTGARSDRSLGRGVPGRRRRAAGRPRPFHRARSGPGLPDRRGDGAVGAAVPWDARDLVPRRALRVAKDHYEDGADELAASYLALVQEAIDPGEDTADDALAWAAQSLLVSVLQRSGSAAQAEEIARDLAAHSIPLDLWRDDDPSLPDSSMAWHGGAFVGGIP